MPFTRQRHNGTKHPEDTFVNGTSANDVFLHTTSENETVVKKIPAASSSHTRLVCSLSTHVEAHADGIQAQSSSDAIDNAAHLVLMSSRASASRMWASRAPVSSASRLSGWVFALCAGLVSMLPASAKPTGVWGWTSGSQTYLRARPGALTPAVAKVPRHTKMFVWGKFDGWYRVETPDHKFGWVFNSYIKSPDEDKIVELSHRKAKLASDRTEDQTMYGSPALLRQHLARYGARGAAQGLAKQGIRTAGLSSSRRASTRTAKARLARTTQIRTTQTRMAARGTDSHGTAWREVASTSTREQDRFARASEPDFNDVGNVRLMPARPLQSRRDEDRYDAPNANSAASSRASTEDHSTVRVSAPVARKTRAPHKTQANVQHKAQANVQHRANQNHAAQAAIVQQRALAQAQRIAQTQAQAAQNRLRESTEKANLAQTRKARAQAARKRLEQQRAEQARVLQAQKTEEATRQKREAAAALLVQQKTEQQRLAQQKAAAQQAAQQEKQQKLAQQRVAQQKLAQEHAAQEHAAQKRLAEQQAAQKRVAERARRAEEKRKLAVARRAQRVARYAREAQVRAQRRALRAQRLAQAKAWKRNQLRTRLGAAAVEPPLAEPGLRPLSPDELLRARNDYLAAQKKNQPSVASGAIVAPDGASSRDATPSAAITPSAYQAPDNALVFSTVTRVSYSRRAKVSSRSGANARTSRGGSPRDYMYGSATTSTSGSLFGQTMARQAMTYRGMPYISGAASPDRGFDCSGLVYYLLRQRGYNPPRTAAGMASFGQAVSRNELQSGDLILFANTYKRGISHVGIYIGEGKFVHAANHSKGVSVDSLNSKYYSSKYYSARRVK